MLTKRVEPNDSLDRLEDGNPDAEEVGQPSRAHTHFRHEQQGLGSDRPSGP